MSNITYDTNILACKEIFDVYIEIISKHVENNSNTLAQIEAQIACLKTAIDRARDSKLKIRYCLSFIPRFIVAFLMGDTACTSFDDYRYYAMKKTGVIPGYSSAELQELYSHQNRCNEIIQFYVKLKNTLLITKQDILISPELAKTFFDKYSRKEKDSNIFYRLFDVLNEMNFDIQEVYTMAVNGFIGNIKSRGFVAVDKLNACVEKYKA